MTHSNCSTLSDIANRASAMDLAARKRAGFRSSMIPLSSDRLALSGSTKSILKSDANDFVVSIELSAIGLELKPINPQFGGA